jgi:hypothetical protein
MLAARAEGDFIVGLEDGFLNAHLVYVRSIGRIPVAENDLAGIIQAHPGMLTGDLIIHQYNLALGLITADDKTFGGNSIGVPGKKSGSGQQTE